MMFPMPAARDNIDGIEALCARVDRWRAALPAEDAPRLRCVLLFGSRARGDHRPDSDWDIAALWRGAPPARPAPVAEHDGQRVEWLDADAEAFARRAVRVGTLPRLASRQGIALFGQCPVQNRSRGDPMNHMDWAVHFDSICDNAVLLVRGLRGAAAHGMERMAWKGLIKGSADLAEHVAKLVLDMKGIDAEHIHDLDRLAKQLPDNDRYAALVQAMNGGARRDHLAGYSDVFDDLGPEDNQRALERSADALALLRQILEDPAHGSSCFETVSMTDSLWSKAQALSAYTAEQWTAHVLPGLAQAILAGAEDRKRVEQMREHAAWIGAWANDMAEDIAHRRAEALLRAGRGDEAPLP